MRLTATIAHSSDSIPEPTSANLPTKPENGGSPAMLSAGSANSTAIIGALRTRPPMRDRRSEPARRSTRPATRNSAVFTTMWCTT